MPIPAVVDFFSFLGREYFWGRVHTLHDQWWVPTLRFTLAVLAAPALRKLRAQRQSTDRERWLFLFGHVAAPLAVCGMVCVGYQVIYYRPRYVFLLLPYFLMLLAWSCSALDSRKLGGAALACLSLLMVTGSWVQQQTPQKLPWRETAAAWPDLPAPAFLVIQPDFHQLPLRHYLGGEIRSTPTAVLEKLGRLPTGAHIWVASWPEALSLEDAQAREWLAGIGPAQKLPLPGYYQLTRLEPAGGDVWPEFAAERFRAWYRPFDIAGELAGFSDARRFSQLGFDNDGSVYRTAMRDAWLRLEGVAAGESVALSVAAEGSSRVAYYLKRGPTPDGLLDGPAVTPDAVVASNGKELSFRAPPGDESLWLGWKRAADSDTATPGLRVNWLAVEPAGAARNVASRP